MTQIPQLIYQLTEEDKNYLPFLKGILGGRAKVKLLIERPVTVTQIVMQAKQIGCSQVFTSSPVLLKLLLGIPGEKLPSLDDYAGSIIEKAGVEFLILNPLEHLVTVPYGKFLTTRYLDKFLEPGRFLELPAFKWLLFTPEHTDEVVTYLAGCNFIAMDIETKPEIRDELGNLLAEKIMTCCSFTGVQIHDGRIEQLTVCVPATDEYNIAVIAALSDLPVAKCFQNGKYDNAYLLRYGICVRNWCADTQHLFHSWYSELPKRLDFLASFVLRKWIFWKNEADTTDLLEYYQYNAKDSFATAMIWIGMCIEAPAYAWKNYIEHEFPLVFPCILAEMTGIKADKKEMELEEARFNVTLEKQLANLRVLVGNKFFNPSSADQVVRLFQMLGCQDIKSTGPSQRDKVAFRHPLNKLLVKAIEKYRKDRKLVTSYLRDYNPKTKKYKTWHSRVFFALNPHATDTARLASKESAYWCGLQIQNIPRDRDDIQVKRIFISDPGFLFGEADYEQAEARDVAYLSGDRNLIAAVDNPARDFHGHNASAFFGISYDKIVNSYLDTAEWIHKVIDKALRDLSKRTNHGANYNMGAGVLLDTMGIEKVLAARKLLSLSSRMSALAVCQHLLDVYAETYPIVKKEYYDKIKGDVAALSMLVSPLGWTRYCFGNPAKSKVDLNAYVAHPSQNLNAGTLNLAVRRVFREVWYNNQLNFKLGPQIHDSILFQYRRGYEELAWQVKDCMEFDVQVRDTFGITRTLRVPVALKGNAERWSEVEPMKCFKLEL